MKHARFLGIAATVALFGLVGATPAAAVQGTTPTGLIQDVNVTQTATQAGQATGATITTALRKADTSHPSATFGITVNLPAGMTRNTGSFATCERAVLQSQGPAGCPSGSVIGTGSATFDARTVVTDPISARVTIFNGTNGSVLLYVFPDLGPTLVVEGLPVGSSTIEFVVPPIFTLPSAPLAALTQLTLNFAPGYLTNPPDCPSAGWTWGFEFSYENGESLPLSVGVPCTGGPPPPTGNGKNRAKACKAERAQIGIAAFREKYGANKKGSNAFGKCVSGKNH